MFLGVDGGGTKTAFALVDGDGRIVALQQQGSAYHLEIGMEGAEALLARGVTATLAQAGIAAQDVHFAFFGLPAYGEDSALRDRFDALPAAVLPVGRYRCDNDVVCGWAGSLACGDGIGIVAGTGSIAYGAYAGRNARAGGWGEMFSDEGSAYWIAREGLNLFSRMSDGRAEKGPLHAMLRSRLNLEGDLDLCAAVYGRLAGERSAVANLARAVFEAASAGDVGAVDIFVRAARELVALVEATRRALGVPETVSLPVSYSGGVFGSPLVLAPFARALQAQGTRYDLTPPRFAPVIGAALYAAQCIGQPLGRPALARLEKQATEGLALPG